MLVGRSLPSYLSFVKRSSSGRSSGSSIRILVAGVPVTLCATYGWNHYHHYLQQDVVGTNQTSLDQGTSSSSSSSSFSSARTPPPTATTNDTMVGEGVITRTALVVGGTSGIGQGIALALAKHDRTIAVTIAGRNEERGAEIVKLLQEINPHQNHSFQKVNAFDLNSIKELSTLFGVKKKSSSQQSQQQQSKQQQQQQLDLLVMTQGMATIQGYTPTIANRLDEKLQLHYFSRIYLANLLAPSMNPHHGRILTILSAGVHDRYPKWEEDFELKNKGSYSIPNAANAAGFYTDAGFDALAKNYPSLIVAHAAPGMVNTNWGTEFPFYIRFIVRCLQPLVGRSLEECGELLTSGWLGLVLPNKNNTNSNGDGDGDDTVKTNNFFLLDQHGKVITNGIKHSTEERTRIWTKTLEVLPK